MADRSLSLPMRLIVQYVLTILLLVAITQLLPQYLRIEGSLAAIPTVAALLLLLNLFARPILKIITLPFRLFMTVVAVILVNGAFLWLLESIAERFDPATAVLVVEGGTTGWIVVALLLGLGNWILHHILK